MSPIQSGIPAQQYAAATSVSQPLEPSGSQAQPNHPATLSPAQLSDNAYRALNQVTGQPNVVSLIHNALQRDILQLHSINPNSPKEVTYQASVRQSGSVMSIGHITETTLTIHTRLNDQSQYDIISANVHNPSTSVSVVVNLPGPPPASTHAEASSARASTPANVPDRDQGVKSPKGFHFRVDIKEQILALRKDKLTPPQIAAHIPGLSLSQVHSVIRTAKSDSRQAKKASAQKRARELLGPDATAPQYSSLMRAAKAREFLGPGATSGDYDRMKRAQKARELTGLAYATAADSRDITEGIQAQRELGPGATRSDLRKVRAADKVLAKLLGISVSEVRALRRQGAPGGPDASTARAGVEIGQSFTPSTGRPIVTLANAQVVQTRSWNAGDRFSIPGPGPNGQLQYFQVNRARLGDEEISPGDFQSILMGG